MSFAPLAGIRVVDVTSSLAGPTCTEILGGLGADVVKVEHPARGDEARAWGPSFFDGGSVMFFAANRSKRSLALDFKDDQGLEALLRLVDGADVFVQSLRAGTASGSDSAAMLCVHATTGSSTARFARSADRGRLPASRATTR